MPKNNSASHQAIPPLATLIESRQGAALPLPPRLVRLYGSLRMPPLTGRGRGRPWVFSNFVTSLDGVVSLSVPGHDSGADISGFNAQDRMVMGLLRAMADAVIVGAGTLAADRQHVWTAEEICPELAPAYRSLRAALGKGPVPLNVVVSASGAIDLELPLFAKGKVPVLILTNPAGARRFANKAIPAAVTVRGIGRGAGLLSARAILKAVQAAVKTASSAHPGTAHWLLVEGGPRLLGDFYAARLVDEQFLTLSPQIAGREEGGKLRPSLVMGQAFAPRHPLWGRLTDMRRGASHLFLRYSFDTGTAADRGKAAK